METGIVDEVMELEDLSPGKLGFEEWNPNHKIKPDEQSYGNKNE